MRREGQDNIKSSGQEGGRCWDAAERGQIHHDCKKKVHRNSVENKSMLRFPEME